MTDKDNCLTAEQELEKEIKAKGLSAPRLTPDWIDSVIKGVTYTVLPSGRTMVCEMELKNGFSVLGKSACVSKENFNQEIGEKISYANAREKIWEFEGYLLKQHLHDASKALKQ